jgi:hypothetical protein
VGERARREDTENQEPPADGEGHDVASLDLTGVQENLVGAEAQKQSRQTSEPSSALLQYPAGEVSHPPQSGWLEGGGRLKGGHPLV